MPASRSLFVVFFFFARVCPTLAPEPELRLRRWRISGPINEADLPRKQMIPPPSDRGPIVLARRWQTMASCLWATVVNSPSSPFASPSAASRADTNPLCPAPDSHAALLRAELVGNPLDLRGCYCAGLRRTRADIDGSGFHHSSIDLVAYNECQSQPESLNKSPVFFDS